MDHEPQWYKHRLSPHQPMCKSSPYLVHGLKIVQLVSTPGMTAKNRQVGVGGGGAGLGGGGDVVLIGRHIIVLDN